MSELRGSSFGHAREDALDWSQWRDASPTEVESMKNMGPENRGPCLPPWIMDLVDQKKVHSFVAHVHVVKAQEFAFVPEKMLSADEVSLTDAREIAGTSVKRTQ